MIHVKTPKKTVEVIRISNADTIKYIRKQAIRSMSCIQQGWTDNIDKANKDFNSLCWIRRNFWGIFAIKQKAAIKKAEFENGLRGCVQHSVCAKFIRQSAFTNTFYLGKQDTEYLWVPELWDRYTKTNIPVIEKVF